MRAWFVCLVLLVPVTHSLGETYEARIPLKDGRLATADLSGALLQKLNINGIELSAGSIDLSGLRGGLFVRALNASLGDGCQVELHGDCIVLRGDPARLPRSYDALRQSLRLFTATAAPSATAAQHASYGLLLPRQVSANRPIVVLIHGLDCNRANWRPMADLLEREGFTPAFFTYPSDGPLGESGELLAHEMRALRNTFRSTPIHIIAFSMGGLVARDYIEGEQYVGGVENFIMIGTPNAGSRWATYRWALEIEEHYGLRRNDPNWHWTWMITDGLGEAGRDLKPRSKFLKSLNSRSRRSSVRYTIIAGNRHPALPIAADAINRSADVIPDRAAKWWGLRHADRALRRAAERTRECTGRSDGPVSVASTRLAGVEDHVVVPADHTALYYPIGGADPAAWPIIRDRLRR